MVEKTRHQCRRGIWAFVAVRATSAAVSLDGQDFGPFSLEEQMA